MTNPGPNGSNTPHSAAIATRLVRKGTQEKAMREQLLRLKGYKVEAELVGLDLTPPNPCVKGTCDTHPFLIYIQWMVAPNGEYAGVMCIRYMGNAYTMVDPLDILSPTKKKKKKKKEEEG